MPISENQIQRLQDELKDAKEHQSLIESFRETYKDDLNKKFWLYGSAGIIGASAYLYLQSKHHDMQSPKDYLGHDPTYHGLHDKKNVGMVIYNIYVSSAYIFGQPPHQPELERVWKNQIELFHKQFDESLKTKRAKTLEWWLAKALNLLKLKNESLQKIV